LFPPKLMDGSLFSQPFFLSFFPRCFHWPGIRFFAGRADFIEYYLPFFSVACVFCFFFAPFSFFAVEPQGIFCILPWQWLFHLGFGFLSTRTFPLVFCAGVLRVAHLFLEEFLPAPAPQKPPPPFSFFQFSHSSPEEGTDSRSRFLRSTFFAAVSPSPNLLIRMVSFFPLFNRICPSRAAAGLFELCPKYVVRVQPPFYVPPPPPPLSFRHLPPGSAKVCFSRASTNCRAAFCLRFSALPPLVFNLIQGHKFRVYIFPSSIRPPDC